MAENKETKLIKKELTDLVYDAFRLFYEENQDIIDINIHECTLSSRLAFYLQSLLNLNPNKEKYEGYIVDCEYNRSIIDFKKIYPDCNYEDFTKKERENNTTVRPDIIIHKRGKKENLIVIELKKEKASTEKKDNDIKRLKYFTNQKSQYKYKLGVFVLIGEKDFNLTFFENGEESYKLCYSKLKS